MSSSRPHRAVWNAAPMASLGLAVALGAGAADSPFKLQSSAIAPNSTLSSDQVYDGFGCNGKNISPELKWSGAPKEAKGFAVTMYDPDAPTGSGWWHWLVYNIPASVSELPSGAGDPGGKLPAAAVQGRTSFGSAGYGGACPPAGDKPHRYIITVYALKADKLDVPAGSSAALVGSAIDAHKLASASLTARYGR